MAHRNPTFSSLLSLPDKGEKILSASLNMSYTIQSLTAGLIYYVRVSAANKQGYSGYALPTPAFGAPSNQIPGRPSGITVTQYPAAPSATADKNALFVQWSAPVVPNHGLWCSGGGSLAAFAHHNACPVGMGIGQDADGGSGITKYILEWDTVSAFGGSEDLPHKGKHEVTTLGTRPFSKKLSGLTCGRNYYVRVSAYNSIGDGKTCALGGTRCDSTVLIAAPGPVC